MKILVSVGSVRDWKPHFGIDFTLMMMATAARGREINMLKLDIRAAAQQSSLSKARQGVIDLALTGGYTHVAMFDDDMMFPPDTILRLAKHNKPFVCANACQKHPGLVNGVCLNDAGERIDSRGKTGLELIWFGSLAVCFIAVSSFRTTQKPHFNVEWLNDENGYQGEDHYFMRKMGQANIPFYCDHDLSQQVKHVGDYPYGFAECDFQTAHTAANQTTPLLDQLLVKSRQKY